MKYILEKLNLNFDQKSPLLNSIDRSKYSHVQKIILLSGKSKSGKDFIATKLNENVPSSLLLHMNNCFKNDEEKKEINRKEDSMIFCRMLLEKNDQLCLTHSIWIIDDIRYSKEIEFFKNLFDDRVLLVRIEASNETREKRGWNIQDDDQFELEINMQWSFVFSNNDEDNFNEQMNNLMKMIN